MIAARANAGSTPRRWRYASVGGCSSRSKNPQPRRVPTGLHLNCTEASSLETLGPDAVGVLRRNSSRKNRVMTSAAPRRIRINRRYGYFRRRRCRTGLLVESPIAGFVTGRRRGCQLETGRFRPEPSAPRRRFQRGSRNQNSFCVRRQRQESFLERAGRAALSPQFLARAHGDQFAAVDDADAVGHFLGDAQLVRGHQHGHAGP